MMCIGIPSAGGGNGSAPQAARTPPEPAGGTPALHAPLAPRPSTLPPFLSRWFTWMLILTWMRAQLDTAALLTALQGRTRNPDKDHRDRFAPPAFRF
jgi:hypothetical protein